jgi:hypothetical protein
VVAKESGAPANQHPARVDAAALRAQLGTIEAQLRRGVEPLFDGAELDAVAPVLVKALSLARPDEDVQLVSTARRGGAMATPTAVTARLFVQADALQLIVHDTRYDFLMDSRMSRQSPKFVVGSREQAGADTLRSPAAAGKRADWLAFPMKHAERTVAAAAPGSRTPVARRRRRCGTDTGREGGPGRTGRGACAGGRAGGAGTGRPRPERRRRRGRAAPGHAQAPARQGADLRRGVPAEAPRSAAEALIRAHVSSRRRPDARGQRGAGIRCAGSRAAPARP